MDTPKSPTPTPIDPVERLRRASPEAAKIIRELLVIEKKWLGYERVPRTVRDDVVALIKKVVRASDAKGHSDET